MGFRYVQKSNTLKDLDSQNAYHRQPITNLQWAQRWAYVSSTGLLSFTQTIVLAMCCGLSIEVTTSRDVFSFVPARFDFKSLKRYKQKYALASFLANKTYITQTQPFAI